ncbi:MAG: hypothetical protein IJQ62_01840 [Clostridia bacterium]|nr:hypothetical protein [Clostridia bacterium]
MTYKTEDLKKTKQIVAEAMAIIQTMAEALTKKDSGQELTQLEQELLFDLESCYGNGEDIVKDIDAIVEDCPWNGEPA